MIKNYLPGIYPRPGRDSNIRTSGRTEATGLSDPAIPVFKPGDIIEGLILKAQGSIYTIDTGMGEILAKSERSLEPGSLIKLQVLDDRIPASVKLIQEVSSGSSTLQKAAKDFLALRSNLSNLPRLVQDPMGASSRAFPEIDYPSGLPHGFSDLARAFVQGGDPEPEKLRLLMGLISFDPSSKIPTFPLKQILMGASESPPLSDMTGWIDTKPGILVQKHTETSQGQVHISRAIQDGPLRDDPVIGQIDFKETITKDSLSSGKVTVQPGKAGPDTSNISRKIDMPNSQGAKAHGNFWKADGSRPMTYETQESNGSRPATGSDEGSWVQRTTGPMPSFDTGDTSTPSRTDVPTPGPGKSFIPFEKIDQGLEIITKQHTGWSVFEGQPSDTRARQPEARSTGEHPIQGKAMPSIDSPRKISNTFEGKDDISHSPKGTSSNDHVSRLHAARTPETVPQDIKIRHRDRLHFHGKEVGIEITDRITAHDDSQKQDGAASLRTIDERLESHQRNTVPSWVEHFVNHVESIHNLRHLYQKELNLALVLIPFIFENGQGTGHWAVWGEEDKGQHGKRSSGYHLAFDLDLNNLVPVKIHIFLRSKRLDIYMGAASEGLTILRQGFFELKQSLQRLGYQVELTEVFTIEGAGQPLLPGMEVHDVLNPKGSCHFVT